MSLLQFFTTQAKYLFTQTTSTISRIVKSFTNTTTTVSRLTKAITALQSTVSRVTKSLSQTTSTISRVSKGFSLTSSTVSRIRKTITALQTIVSRVTKAITQTTTTVSRIVKSLIQTSTTVSRIVKSLTSLQTTVSRITKSFTNTTNSVSRLTKTFSNTTATVSRVNKNLTATQTTVSNIQIVPTVYDLKQSSTSLSGTTFTITYPTYSANQTVVINIASEATMTVPTGWTQIATKSGGATFITAIYKIMDGSEGSTLSITFGSATNARSTQYSINAGPGLYKVLTAGATTSSYTGSFSPTPPAITFSGTNNYLIFNALVMTHGVTEVISSYPSNMQDNKLSTASASYSIIPGIASSSATVFNVSSFTPTAYSFTGSGTIGAVMTYGLYFAYEAKTQPTISRISNAFTSLQTTISRLLNSLTRTSSTKSSIQGSVAKTTSTISKIVPLTGTKINVPFVPPLPISVTVIQQSAITISVAINDTVSLPVSSTATITIPLRVNYPN